jgi:hypothetical protein
MYINYLISMTLYYPNPGQADQGRVLFYLVSMPIFYPTLSNDSINDTTKKFHDMPKSSTEHPPSPIVGKSPPLGVTLSFGSLEAGDTVHSIPKRLIRFGSSTLFCNFSNASCQLGVLRIKLPLPAESGIRHASACETAELGRGGRGERGHINEPGLHDPRVLYRRRPRRNSLNRSRITRNSSSLRPAGIAAGKRRRNPRSCRKSGTERRVGLPATGPSAKNNGVCQTGGYCIHYIC